MNHQQDRPLLLLTLLEPWRLEQPPVHRLTLRTFEPEVAARVQSLPLQPACGEARELRSGGLRVSAQARVETVEHEDVVRGRQRRARVEKTAIREWLDRRRGARGRDLAWGAKLCRKCGVGRRCGRGLGHGEGEDLGSRVVNGSEEHGLVVARELGGEGPAQSSNNFGGKSLRAYRNRPDSTVPVLSEGILDVLLEIVNHELGTAMGQQTIRSSF